MAKRTCDSCRYMRYWAGTRWEPPEWDCARETEWGRLVDRDEMSEEAGDTEDCLLWEPVPEGGCE